MEDVNIFIYEEGTDRLIADYVSTYKPFIKGDIITYEEQRTYYKHTDTLSIVNKYIITQMETKITLVKDLDNDTEYYMHTYIYYVLKYGKEE